MWDQLAVFAAVVDEGSFRGAAARLGIARSSVSRAVAALEDELGVRLLHRTTRQVQATAEGATLHARVAPLLGALAHAVQTLPAADDAPTGTLRLTTTEDYAAVVLAPVIARYVARYPQVRVETVLTDRIVDLAAERIDVAIRFSMRAIEGSGTARRIGLLRTGLYASPTYLAQHGAPADTQALQDHVLVGYPALVEAFSKTPPQIGTTTMQLALSLALAHAGIVALSGFLAEPAVRDGRLVPVLPEASGVQGQAWLVTPGPGPLPSRVTAFRDLLIETLGASE